MRGATVTGTRCLTWGAEKAVKMWDLSEAAQMEPEKKGRKKHMRGKKKQKGVRLAEKRDTFFDDF
jgi:hypothetical protein